MFRTSAPATGTGFHDRVAELRRLDGMMEALAKGTPRWLAIIGVRKVGKTSLVLEAARRSGARDVRFVALDVFESLPVSLAFFRSYAIRVADRLLAPSLGISLEALAAEPDDYRRDLAATAGFTKLPGGLRADLLSLPDRPTDAEMVKLALDLPQRLAAATGARVVVSIDEFQELAGVGRGRVGIDPLPLMRSLWQKHDSVSYVVSGSARSMLMELATSKRSPFFQHFDLMELGPFAIDDAVALLVEQSPRGRRIPSAVARKAVEVLGGHPFYLQVLGEALVEREPPYDESDLKDTLQALLFSKTGRLALYFQNEFERAVGRSAQLAVVLTELATGPQRLSDVARTAQVPTGATAGLLARLGDTVEKQEDGRYRLCDPTFGLWLRWRAPGGTALPMAMVGNEAEQAAALYFMHLGFDLIYQSRASRGAFDLLATRGARQLGVQVKRTDLPVRFSPPAWKRMEGEAARFGWRWIVAVVNRSGEVSALDPARVRGGRKGLALDQKAVIDNLLVWLDRSPIT